MTRARTAPAKPTRTHAASRATPGRPAAPPEGAPIEAAPPEAAPIAATPIPDALRPAPVPLSAAPRPRIGFRQRETNESRVGVGWALDGSGRSRITTPVPFLTHMLEQIARHGLFDLEIEARGDTHIDDHHTVEDIGIVSGLAFREACGDRRGIARMGSAAVPLDEALVECVVDISGRPFLVYNVDLPPGARIGTFDGQLVCDFFQAFATEARINLHFNLRYGRNHHHVVEAAFKAFARALNAATRQSCPASGAPSTKGLLDG